MPRKPGEAENLTTLISLAALDVVRARRNDRRPAIDELVLQIVDGAESAEDALYACIQMFGIMLDKTLGPLGMDAEELLEGLVTRDTLGLD